MSKLCLAVSILAFGVTLAGGQAHAALRAGVTPAKLQPYGDKSILSCNQCKLYRMPSPGDAVTLNPRHLPPWIVAGGRMPHR
jgi:hypothetical protein